MVNSRFCGMRNGLRKLFVALGLVWAGQMAVFAGTPVYVRSVTYDDAIVGREVTGIDKLIVVPGTWVTESLVEWFGEDKAEQFYEKYGADLGKALVMPTGKRGPKGEVRTVWDDYLAGTDPTDPDSVFTASIEIVDGEIVISWDPDLNRDSEVRQYRVKGCTSLEANDWTWPANSAIHHFFKVEVRLSAASSSSDKPGSIPANRIKYTVTLDANGGVCEISSKGYPENSTVGELPIATRPGYAFAGWFTALSGGSQVLPSAVLTRDQTYYAIWISTNRDGVQMWEGGPYWSACNLGADTLTDGGHYFWWGGTEGYVRNAGNDGWSSAATGMAYVFNGADADTLDKNDVALRESGLIDSSGCLVPERDAATVQLGAPWRMPTKQDFDTLRNCPRKWIDLNGHRGWLIWGKGSYSRNCLFLPSVGFARNTTIGDFGGRGYYWTATPYADDPNQAWYLYTTDGQFNMTKYLSRNCGQSVRPVRGADESYQRTFVWSGRVSSDWSEGGNWSEGSVPGSEDKVRFVDTAVVNVGSNVSVASVDIADGSTLCLQGHGVLGTQAAFGNGSLQLGPGGALGSISGKDLDVRWPIEVLGTAAKPAALVVGRSANVNVKGPLSGSGTLWLAKSGSGYAGVHLAGDNSSFAGRCFFSAESSARHKFDSADAGSALAAWMIDGVAVDNASMTFVGGVLRLGSIRTPVRSGGSYWRCIDKYVTLEVGALSSPDDVLGLQMGDADNTHLKLRKVGNGTLSVYRTCHRDGTEIAGGVLVACDPESLSGSQMNREARISFHGGTLKYGDYQGVPVTTDWSYLIFDSTAAISVDTDGKDVVWSYPLSASNVGGLVKKGAGSLTLKDVPRYKGKTRVEEGTLIVPSGTVLSEVEVRDGARLVYSEETGYGEVAGRRTFRHPGLAYTQADLDRMKAMVAAKREPWYSAFCQLRDGPAGNVKSVPSNRGGEILDVNDSGWSRLTSDGRRAFDLALLYHITEDTSYADAAVGWINANSNYTNITQRGTGALHAGSINAMIQAAELLRDYPGWRAEDQDRFKRMLVYPGYSNSVYPVDSTTTFYWAAYNLDAPRSFVAPNQSQFAARALIAMGIYLDNDLIYDRARRLIMGMPSRTDDIPLPSGPPIFGNPNEAATNFVTVTSASGEPRTLATAVDVGGTKTYGRDWRDYPYGWRIDECLCPSGQSLESVRDQGHAITVIHVLAEIAEMCWNQGDDLFSAFGNRILCGSEWACRYNYSDWEPIGDCADWEGVSLSNQLFFVGAKRETHWRKSLRVSPLNRGHLGECGARELILAHYGVRAGLASEACRWTQLGLDRVIETFGCEKNGWSGHPNENFGWGTLGKRLTPWMSGEPGSWHEGNWTSGIHALPCSLAVRDVDRTRAGTGQPVGQCSLFTNGADMQAGDWFQFTVSSAADEGFVVRLKGTSSGAVFKLSADGESEVTLDWTAGAASSQEQVLEVPAGASVIRVFCISGQASPESVEVSKVTNVMSIYNGKLLPAI